MLDKILLLNPPVFGGKRYIRSGYCNSVSKGGYYWSPIDLLVQSGILKNNFDISVLDASALNLSPEKTIKFLYKNHNDFFGMFFISSLASYQYDFPFAEKLKTDFNIKKILVSAGFLLFDNSKYLQNYKAIDGVLLDYTSNESIDFFKNEKKDYSFISTASNIKNIEQINRISNIQFEYPVPLHLKFPLKQYYMPNCKKLPMTNIITNLGCPFKCGFCTWSALKYRQRKIENTIEELKYLNNNGISEIMFIDPTFGANKKYTETLLKQIIHEKINIGFSIECRVDLIEENFIKLLKNAGCHSITFGIESGNDEILKNIKKGFSVADIKRAFSLCHKYSLKPTGHFIIGLPGESVQTITDTINLAIELDCDFASFNIVMPLPGTEMFKKYNFTEAVSCSDVESPLLNENVSLTPDEIVKYSKFAFKKFYFRPKYIFKTILKFKNWVQLKIILREFFLSLKR